MATGYKQILRIFYAYHEAGHAVVWHALGGLIEEVSIASGPGGYKGYCVFGPLLKQTDFLEEANDSKDFAAQLAQIRLRPERVTASYAGMLALAYYCASYQGEEDYPEGSEQDDLKKIDALLAQISSDPQEREHIKETCWHQAQEILHEYFPVVSVLVERLLKQRTLSGADVHRLVWKMTGFPEHDWRFQALNLRRKS